MSFQLRKLTVEDGMDIYEMLQEIPRNEDGFINSVKGKTFEEYKNWLISSNNTSKGIGLADWKVPTTIYWLYADGEPVGIGKLRHYLTDKLKEEGGQVGYSIRPTERKKGYMTQMLAQALIYCKEELNLEKVMLGCYKENIASRKTIINAGGILEREYKTDEGELVQVYWVKLK